MVSARSLVPSLRLSRMRRFFSGVQRPSPMLSPARCTTASWPSRREASIVPEEGSQPTSALDAGERVRRVVSWPPDSRAGIRADPMSPVAPLMRTFICSSRVAPYVARPSPRLRSGPALDASAVCLSIGSIEPALLALRAVFVGEGGASGKGAYRAGEVLYLR